ncbi:sulfite exporter TauE/SafE family protein [Brevibacillus dissolubilis]|uniref:sulfite exporter TauE/SafE family protein n=1 Tax=Brevibacillus dissolubilis TaxID=1844116 RepID=UPI0011175837|nr:sulfite exporter TauE/SafE family protein [Brevibacillus dissolubilis]
MTTGLFFTLIAIGFIGAFLSGLLGIGGAIITYPMLLYIPAALGVIHYTPHQVSGMIALQVFAATLSGVLSLRRERLIHPGLVLTMGSAVLIGSFTGAFGGSLMSSAAVNLMYAILASIASVMMVIPKKGVDDLPLSEVTFNRGLAVGSALTVGLASGVVGAGGAFLLVPVMLSVLRIPTRITIASSLAITFLSSVGAGVGKLIGGDVLLLHALILIGTSIIAAPLGTKVGRQLNARLLRSLLAVLIFSVTIKIWIDIFSQTPG